jgi:hypothetical protein
VGPRDGLGRCGKSRPLRDSIHGPSSPLPVAIPTELPGLTQLVYLYVIRRLDASRVGVEPKWTESK